MKTYLLLFPLLVASAIAQTPMESLRRQVTTNTVTGSLAAAPYKVETIAALKAVAATARYNGQQVEVANYATANDGGGGTFYFAAASSATANDGTVLAPNAGSGRWIRVYDGDINVRWFGAKGDGSTDDTAEIAAAIAAAIADARDVFVPRSSSSYLVSRQGTQAITFGSQSIAYVFLITSPVNITCEGSFSISVVNAAQANLFLVHNTSNVTIRGVTAVGSGSPESNVLYNGAAVAISSSTKCIVDGITATNMRGGVTLFSAKGVTVSNSVAEITAGRYSGAHFAAYASDGCSFVSCVSYQGTTDGDFVLYGSGINNSIVDCRAFNYSSADATKTITSTSAHGICVDAGESGAKVIGCTAYGYYYGIDVKAACDSVLVESCTAIKNKVGVAVRRGELNAPTINTTVRGCTIIPRNGNGEATVVLNGFAILGIYVQDPQGVLIEGNQIGVTYLDGGGAQTFLSLGYTTGVTADSGGKLGVNIRGNRFVHAVNYSGSNPTNSNTAIYVVGGATGVVENLSIVGNEFKLQYGTQNYDAVSITYCNGATITGNTFSNVTIGTGAAVSLTSCNGIVITGNSWNTHNRLLKATTSKGITFSSNVMEYGVGGNTLAQIYFDDVQGATIADNTYYRLFGGFTDGRWLEAVNISAGAFYLTMTGNQLKQTNFDHTNYYSVNGTAIYSASDVVVSGNQINGTRSLPLAAAFLSLTDGATITLTCDTNKSVQNATVTLGGNRTLAISGAVSGMTGVLIVKQDGAGSRTLALPAASKVVNTGSGAVSLSTAASAIDVLSWVYDGTNYLWTYGNTFN